MLVFMYSTGKIIVRVIGSQSAIQLKVKNLGRGEFFSGNHKN